MFILLINSIIIILISIILMILASILSKKSFSDREKNSPFECGFDPKCSARLPFSLHFFLIAIIFLIFDIEIALLFPIIIILNYSNLMMWIYVTSYFITILLLGLYHEWNQGALEWTK
uniref:NADH-ubiquinone oxidoreductase chain 3 n=1 Tax=Rapisma zayuanum TaxID=1419480 RepID=V9PN86_9NEOP|nr:NADH dehydrogenase subunit 3 [Rapisma zayuanum]AHA35673.1 NADH dehydrogenase subunit 3 [Rapisma zayuanum]ARO47938.1 NADH dehydrogenase subunit 3 [Rapisma sp. 1 NS-2017]